LHAFCGDAFFDDLLSHPEVVESYKGTPMAQVLREGYVYPNGMKVYGAFEFGGIVWENYRGKIGNTPIIDPDKCHIFPVGVPGLFVTRYAPADYVETVNTVGLPRYSRQFMMPNGKGVYLDVQMNAINYCSRPNVLVQGKRTSVVCSPFRPVLRAGPALSHGPWSGLCAPRHAGGGAWGRAG